MIIIVGYIAFALNVAGNLLLAHKNMFGWDEGCSGFSDGFVVKLDSENVKYLSPAIKEG